MKLNRMLKIILIILLVIFFVITPIYVNASSGNFNLDAFEGGNAGSFGQMTEGVLGSGISIVRIIGTGIAIVIIMVIAMKYMMAAPGDRADIKRHAVPFVIGAFVLFGTSQILGILADFAGKIS